MSEVIAELSPTIHDEDGHPYAARVLGEERADGLWAGRIEFRPLSGGLPRRTGVETTQPNLGALRYWASGLEAVYLEGALERAIARRRGNGRRTQAR